MMHGAEKSGLVIVAGKPANKAEQPAPEGSAAMLNAAEPVERRAGTKGNADQQSTRRTQSRVSVSQALERNRKNSGIEPVTEVRCANGVVLNHPRGSTQPPGTRRLRPRDRAPPAPEYR